MQPQTIISLVYYHINLLPSRTKIQKRFKFYLLGYVVQGIIGVVIIVQLIVRRNCTLHNFPVVWIYVILLFQLTADIDCKKIDKFIISIFSLQLQNKLSLLNLLNTIHKTESSHVVIPCKIVSSIEWL